MNRCLNLAAVCLFTCFAVPVAAQLQSHEHHLLDADQPPGVASFMALLGNPHWMNTIQPVRIRVPEGATVSYWNGNSFSPASHPAPVLGLSMGPVARVQISLVRPDRTLEIYPSIELVNRLTPPPGLENRFPVEVVLTVDDLVQASDGSLVTRVVYLENPETALPYRQTADNQAFIDLSEREDALQSAARLGRPMAIVRLGSRVPSPDELDAAFVFGGAPIQEFPQQFFDPASFPAGSLIPAEAVGSGIQRAAWNQDPLAQPLPATVDGGFYSREAQLEQGPLSFPGSICDPATAPPAPCDPCGQAAPGMAAGDCGTFRFSVPPKDEFVCDGDDRNFEVLVDQNWNVYGLDTEDTVGHFDTLDGRRLVVPSNRVCIYSPRFAAVRKIDSMGFEAGTDRTFQFRERDQLQLAAGKDFSSTTLQQLMPGQNVGADRASGLRDRTRGVLSDQVVLLKGLRGGMLAYEDLQFIRFGKFNNSESSRLQLGMQSANVWEINDGLQVIGDHLQPVIVNDPLKVQELVTVKVGDGKTLLRVCKLASKIAAEPGEEVDFTIRFDNIGQQLIGNVTIIDSLTPRLEYVDGSAECSLEGNFSSERNEGESLVLRWEITEPVKPGEGGIIRFRCRLR